MKAFAAFALFPLVFFGDGLAPDPDPVEITEWTVPWENSRVSEAPPR
jgi:hypothetical protein